MSSYDLFHEAKKSLDEAKPIRALIYGVLSVAEALHSVVDAIDSIRDHIALGPKDDSTHIRFVHRGETIEDFKVPLSGWVWFDESGLLGAHEIYPSFEAAEEALVRYVEFLDSDLRRFAEEMGDATIGEGRAEG